MDNDKLISEIHKQEQKFQFSEFTNEIAFKIGIRLSEIAITHNYPVVIDISRSGQRLFFYAHSGSSIDNEYWIERKKKLSLRFGCSSFSTKLKYEKIKPASFHNNGIFLDESYTLSGGCFPIIIKNTGIIGTITVSGLTDLDDHNLIIGVLQEHFNQIQP